MISERTLKKWRRDSLLLPYTPTSDVVKGATSIQSLVDELNRRILCLTQVLLDDYLQGRR